MSSIYPALWIGTIFAILSLSGKTPDEKDKFINLDRGKHIRCLIFIKIESGTEFISVFFFFNLSKRPQISSGVVGFKKKDCGTVGGMKSLWLLFI